MKYFLLDPFFNINFSAKNKSFKFLIFLQIWKQKFYKIEVKLISNKIPLNFNRRPERVFFEAIELNDFIQFRNKESFV